MGSMRYYIEDQQERAAKDNAPPTAIYLRGPAVTDWTCLEDVTAGHTQRFIISWAETQGIPLPQSVVDEWSHQRTN
jgi:hypothetical protein